MNVLYDLIRKMTQFIFIHINRMNKCVNTMLCILAD